MTLCLSVAALQEILEEVRKELQKVKEEIIGGKIALYSLILKTIGVSCTALILFFLAFTAFVQELQKRST